jgi:hypothetical protein
VQSLQAAEARATEASAERDEHKRLYELRGKALARPCMKCGYEPLVIKPMKGSAENE